jgi:iron complex transport system permease protein
LGALCIRSSASSPWQIPKAENRLLTEKELTNVSSGFVPFCHGQLVPTADLQPVDPSSTRRAGGATATAAFSRGGAGHRSRRRAVFFLALTIALLIAAPLAISVGSAHVDRGVALRVIGSQIAPFWISAGDIPQADVVIIWLIRVPRVVLAALIGAALAIAGTLMQGLFRNPLAEPQIVGVGSGAVLAAVIVFVTGLSAVSAVLLPIAAVLGALAALAIIYAVATRGGVTPIPTLLLSGIALASLLGAAIQLLISLSFVNWQVAQEIMFWMMGGLDGRSWTHVWLSAPFIVLGATASIYFAPDLDLLAQGEDVAASLGVNVESSKRALMAITALLTGCSVAVAGLVGFIGLIVPHMTRLFVGPTHRALLPSSALAGAVFLIVCDLIARTIHPPAEVRLGIVTAAFGAPFFLFLLIRKNREIG